MKFNRDNKYFPIVIASIITVAACAVIVLIAMNVSKIPELLSSLLAIISPFIYGFFIAYFCNPIMHFFETKVFRFGEKGKVWSRVLALAVSIVVLLLVITLVLLIVIPQLIDSYNDLSENFNEYIKTAQSWADDFIKNFPLFNGKYETISEFLNASEIAEDVTALIGKAGDLLSTVADNVFKYAKQFVVVIKNILMGIIISVYFLYSKDTLAAQLKKLLASIAPRRTYLNLVSLGRFTNRTFGGFISGKILDSIIIGLLSFIVFSIFRLPFTPLISVIVGVTNIIPFFGPIIGAIPSAFIILIAEPSKTILFLILILIIQQLDGNVIGPKILGDSTGISALGVLVAISIGGGLFGIVGMFLGVPAYAVIREIIQQGLDRRLIKRSMPKAIEFYQTDPEENPNGKLFIDRDTTPEDPYFDYTDYTEPTNESKKREETGIWKFLATACLFVKKYVIIGAKWLAEKVKLIIEKLKNKK